MCKHCWLFSLQVGASVGTLAPPVTHQAPRGVCPGQWHPLAYLWLRCKLPGAKRLGFIEENLEGELGNS